MRHSLLIRLLALSISVAVAAVAATAFLASRTTTQIVRSEFDRSLEADAFVYSTLLAWAIDHPDWSGVGEVVDDLAARTGRRVSLVTEDGRVIADALPTDVGRPDDAANARLPESPAAVVDPFAPLTGEMVPTVGSRGSGLSGIPASQDLVSRILSNDPEVRRLRSTAVTEAASCLEAAGYPAESLLVADPPSLITAGDMPYEVGEACDAYSLTALTLPEVEIALQLEEELADCHQSDQDPLVPPRGLTSSGSLEGGAPSGYDDLECVSEGIRSVLGDRVAPPALLYLESPVAPAGLAAAGRTQVIAIVVLVALLVFGVTFVAGRRLVRPVAALTGAAQRMEAGDHAARVPVRGRDEVARLGSAFNAMATALEATEQQRRTMVSDVAHELRSPLTTLQGHLEGVQDGIIEVDEQTVASLLEETSLLQRLVEDLQQLALADAGQLRIDTAEVAVTDLVRQVVAKHRAAAEQAGLGLRVEVDVVDDARVAGDVDRLRQALDNLVLNALRYTLNGEVVVHIRGGEDDADGLVVAVIDTGIGIASDELAHVFDRFYRTDRSRSRVTGGSGLGLAITRSLVEAHGGHVSVSSSPGEGSTFAIHLPRSAID